MGDLRVLSARPVSTEHNATRQPKREFVVRAEVMDVGDGRSNLLIRENGENSCVTVATNSIRCPGMIGDPTVSTGFCDYIAEYSDHVETLVLRGLRFALDIELQRLSETLWRLRHKIDNLAFEHRTLNEFRSTSTDEVLTWLRMCARCSTGNAISIERMIDVVRKGRPRDLAAVLRLIGPDADIDFEWLSESRPDDVTWVTIRLLEAIRDGLHPNAVQLRRGARQAAGLGVQDADEVFSTAEQLAIARDEPSTDVLDFLRTMGWVYDSSDGAHVTPVARAWALGELDV